MLVHPYANTQQKSYETVNSSKPEDNNQLLKPADKKEPISQIFSEEINFLLLEFERSEYLYIADTQRIVGYTDQNPSLIEKMRKLTRNCYEMSKEIYEKCSHEFKRAAYVYYLKGDPSDRIFAHPGKILVKEHGEEKQVTTKDLGTQDSLSDVFTKKDIYSEAHFCLVFEK